MLAFTENGSKAPPEIIVVSLVSLVVNITISFPGWMDISDITRSVDHAMDHVTIPVPILCRTILESVENKGEFSFHMNYNMDCISTYITQG